MVVDALAIGAALRAARAKAGMSLDAVAQCTGHSIGTVSRIETGQRLPSVSMLCELAMAVNVTPGQLLDAGCSFEAVEVK